MKYKYFKILPPLKEIIETPMAMETINYEYSSIMAGFGDREIEDVSRKYIVKVQVPSITFLEWTETLCALKRKEVLTTHLYTSNLEAYSPNNNYVWAYFDQVSENLLTNGYHYSNKYKVRIYVYWIKEFKYHAVLRLLSHHDIVSYSS